MSEPNRHPRVALMCDYIIGGGAENSVDALATGLAERGMRPVICATRLDDNAWEPDDAGVRLAGTGARVVHLDRTGRFDLAPFLRLVRILREERVDILHTHKISSNVWGPVISRLAGVPIFIATEHSWSYEGQPMRRFLDGRFIGPLSSAFVAVSELDARRMRSIEHVPARKIRVIPTALSPRFEVTDPQALRRELGVDADTPLVGTMCTISQPKALEVLVEAFSIVASDHPDALLVIAGQGNRQTFVEQRARELGVADRTRFLGWRTDGGDVLAALDVFAISSDREGTPLALIEAMSAGTAVVSTSVGGIPDVVPNGEAVLVPPREPELLGREISRLLGDPAERERLTAMARARVKDNYEHDTAIDRWCRLYDELMESARRPWLSVPRRRGRSTAG